MEIKYINNKIEIKEDIVAALGEFDGMHLAHQELIKKCITLSKNNNCKSAIICFYPHPDYVLHKRENKGYLNTLQEKIKIIEDFNIDYLYILDFNEELLTTTKEEFFNNYLSNLKGLVIGYDFRFAYKGSGDKDYLNDMFKNKIFEVIEKKTYINEFNKEDKISSNAIRSYLDNGNIEYANKLLSYHYQFEGSVEKGKKVGKELGYPTANISIEKDKYIPKLGVYACLIELDNKKYQGICNIGINPSIDNLNKARIEVNIFDFAGDIYNKNIKVELIHFLREEIKFNTKEELKEEIKKDEEIIKSFFRSHYE